MWNSGVAEGVGRKPCIDHTPCILLPVKSAVGKLGSCVGTALISSSPAALILLQLFDIWTVHIVYFHCLQN